MERQCTFGGLGEILMRRLFILLGVAVLLSASPAFGAFDWLVTPGGGDMLEIKYNNYESLVQNVDDLLFGVGKVTSIGDLTSGTDPVWQDTTTDGGELTLVFYDYKVAYIDSSAGTYRVYFTGGKMDLYYDSTPNADNTKDIAGTNADPDGANNAYDDSDSGTPWLSLAAVAGLLSDDEDTAFDESTATLYADLTALTGFQIGQGNGLLEVIGGEVASWFDGNAFEGGADLSLQSTVRDRTVFPFGGDPNYAAGDYRVRSNDPVLATYVPEPASAAIWVLLGLFGLMVARSRRSK